MNLWGRQWFQMIVMYWIFQDWCAEVEILESEAHMAARRPPMCFMFLPARSTLLKRHEFSLSDAAAICVLHSAVYQVPSTKSSLPDRTDLRSHLGNYNALKRVCTLPSITTTCPYSLTRMAWPHRGYRNRSLN